MLEYIRIKEQNIENVRGKNALSFSFLSHSRDTNFQNTHLFSFSKTESFLKYEYGNLVFFLPHSLLPIVESIKKSEYILNLPNNWDDEGSETYAYETWLGAVSFLLNYALEVFRKEGRVIDVPKIYPSMKGSIDIDWETPKYGWLVNIEKSGLKATYFADNLQTKKELEGEFLTKDFNFYTSPIFQIL